MQSHPSIAFFFSSRRRHTSSVSAFLLNRSSDLCGMALLILALLQRSEERFSGMALLILALLQRSEERRVGKECRSRGWAAHEERNIIVLYIIDSPHCF